MKKAFTLIELLVVIAIIALLAGILFPVLARARERARRAQCIGNLKQVHAAVSLYLEDWDEWYPNAYFSENAEWDTKPPLPQVLQPYVKAGEVWKCPSDTGEVFLSDRLTYHKRTPPFWTFLWSSYTYFGLTWSDYSIGQIAGRTASQVRKPSLAPICLEARPWHGGYRTTEKYAKSPALYNVLYCDGHVAQRTCKQWGDDQLNSVRHY